MPCTMIAICDWTSSLTMSSIPLPDAAQLQKPQDYKETFKVSLYAQLCMQDVFSKSPETQSCF
jgi:hypothetical protein